VWYDLASFPHPGGPVALRLAKGRDATALFEAHHHLLPAPAAARILAPYRCCGRLQGELEAAEGGGHYEWGGFAADEFVKGVRSMLRAHFGAEARRRGVSISDAMKAPPRRRLLVLLLSLSFLLSLPALLGGAVVGAARGAAARVAVRRQLLARRAALRARRGLARQRARALPVPVAELALDVVRAGGANAEAKGGCTEALFCGRSGLHRSGVGGGRTGRRVLLRP
jgi:hypothetical protein